MAVNTGWDTSFIDAAIAEKYKFGPPSYTSVGRVTGRNDQTVVFYSVSDVSVGDEKPINMFMKIAEFTAMKQKIGRDISGVLGADFFKGKTVKIDFKNKTLSFVKQIDTKNNSNANAGNSLAIYKMNSVITNDFGKEIALPICNDILINGKKTKSLLDTGSPYALSLLPSATKDLELEAADKEKTKSLQIKSLKVSDFEANDFAAILFGKDTIPAQYAKGFNAVIGLGVLQNFIVTFDFKGSLIALER